MIEKNVKKCNNIYISDDWVKIVRESRKKNPFVLVEMKAKDFISTDLLEKNITNRKQTTDKAPMSWLKMQWLRYCVDKPYEFFFKESNNEAVLFETLNVKKRSASNNVPIQLPLLYPNGRTIESKKLKDLKDLLPFIPPICHEFYYNLQETHTDERDEEDVIIEMKCAAVNV